MNTFSLSLVLLKDGWADIRFSNDIISKTFVISYVLGDTLSELIDTAIKLVNGENSIINLYLEPQKIQGKIDPKDNDEFMLRVEDLNFIDSRKRYIRQVIKIFDDYLLKHSASDYLKHWHNEFPMGKLEKLRLMLHT